MRAQRRNRVWGGGLAAALLGLASAAAAAPRVVVISLDGAQPDRVAALLARGVLPRGEGLGRLIRTGASAQRLIPATPSLTAVAHIALATGSGAARNDIPANGFHPVGASIGTSLSGFAAPIGGYQLAPLGPSPQPTAEPFWVRARAAGVSVVTATWPGADGAQIRIAGTTVQDAVPVRVTDGGVPFGASGGLPARGYALGAADFAEAEPQRVAEFAAAGLRSFAPLRWAPLESVSCSPTGNCGSGALQYELAVAALDGADDGEPAYDQLVVFDASRPLAPGPHALPATGPAQLAAGGPSARFFFEGSGNRVGTAFFAARLAPDLSEVRLARYAASHIPRPPALAASVDDTVTSVGFWAPQPDFRIPERLAPGFESFPDADLEALYRDQIESFIDYQSSVALRALERNPDADVLMVYLEQPDGAGHQFSLTDRRQASDPRDPSSVGWPGSPAGARGQDRAKLERYAALLEFAYGAADRAVERIIQATGVGPGGRPRSNVFVVSDHGMAPFHSAVHLGNLLRSAGVSSAELALRTSGPALNLYVNLAGREPGGTLASAEYAARVDALAAALRGARDPNPFFSPRGRPLFSRVRVRPRDCGQPGFCTDGEFGQDSGDVFAQLAEGYNFDGVQSPPVGRLGDPAFDPEVSVFSVPNFHGAHGYDSELRSMGALLYAAGPDIRRGVRLGRVRAIDLAPTVLELLGVSPAPSVEGRPLRPLLRRR